MQMQKRDARQRGGAENAGPKDAGGALDNDPVVDELRKLYDGIVEEPVPEQLMDLLRKLDEVERRR